MQFKPAWWLLLQNDTPSQWSRTRSSSSWFIIPREYSRSLDSLLLCLDCRPTRRRRRPRFQPAGHTRHVTWWCQINVSKSKLWELHVLRLRRINGMGFGVTALKRFWAELSSSLIGIRNPFETFTKLHFVPRQGGNVADHVGTNDKMWAEYQPDFVTHNGQSAAELGKEGTPCWAGTAGGGYWFFSSEAWNVGYVSGGFRKLNNSEIGHSTEANRSQPRFHDPGPTGRRYFGKTSMTCVQLAARFPTEQWLKVTHWRFVDFNYWKQIQ